jgi:urease accessory protein
LHLTHPDFAHVLGRSQDFQRPEAFSNGQEWPFRAIIRQDATDDAAGQGEHVTKAATIADQGTEAAQPRAVGELRLSVVLADGTSRIAGLRQAGSLKALFPQARGPALDAVFLNTAGGLTGGDKMRIEADAGPQTHLVLSSQAAERGYRARTGTVARVQVKLSVGSEGRIDWLPQETILYDGAAIERRLLVDLARDARALIVEPVILGRVAMGERVRDLHLTDRWDIRRDGSLVFADALRLDSDAEAQLARPGIAGGAGSWATALFCAPDAAAHLDSVRSLLPPTAGASLVRDGVLFLRILARDGFILRKTLIPVIERLTTLPLPKVWRL